MTDRSKLLALAEAVEKLTGADREVDAEIARTVYADNCRNPDWECGYVLAYTASLDAAMTLVPKGRFVGALNQCDGYGEWYARIEAHDAVFEDAVAPIAALALTAASLRAQAEALS